MPTEQKDLIKVTVPILQEHGVVLTSHFYNRMFARNPELKNIFNMGDQQNNNQQTALAMAVLANVLGYNNEKVREPSRTKPVTISVRT